MWTNYAELGGVAGVDDDGNGFVDDVHGWDFVTGQTGAVGEDVSTPDNDPSDFAGHGTIVAGCAVARTNNGAGIAGTGFRSRFMPLRIGWATQQSPPPSSLTRTSKHSCSPGSPPEAVNVNAARLPVQFSVPCTVNVKALLSSLHCTCSLVTV